MTQIIDDDDDAGASLAATMDSMVKHRVGDYEKSEKSPHQQISELRLQSLDLARAGHAQTLAMQAATEVGNDAAVLLAQSNMQRIQTQFADAHARTKALAGKFGYELQADPLGNGSISGNR